MERQDQYFQTDRRARHSRQFLSGPEKQAMQFPAGSGLEIVQSFDPIPLYEVMEGLGFEHFTEQKGEANSMPTFTAKK